MKILAREDPRAVLALFNLCWGALVFPARWKRARLVLLYKRGARPPAESSSFRPMSLVDAVAKRFERMVLQRLETELANREGLTIKQHGFRRGVGTIDAINRVLELSREDIGRRDFRTCPIISLDMANAFNTAAWPAIDEAGRKKGLSRRMVRLLRSYMEDREIQITTERGGTNSLAVRAGVPQGSVLGPTLWNILYDGMHRLDLQRGVNAVA